MALIDGIMSRRKNEAIDKRNLTPRPLFVWEPIPDLCAPEYIDSFRLAIQQVDIVSPNAEELAGFFSGKSKSQDAMAAEILEWGIGSRNGGLLVVRDGKNGCCAFSREYRIHLAAYHSPVQESQSRVVDPTGAGNAFLGALAVALTGDVCPPMKEASQILARDIDLQSDLFLRSILSLVYATVAASFVIEQPGMPTYNGQSVGRETWNGEAFEDRLMAYLSREHAYLTGQME